MLRRSVVAVPGLLALAASRASANSPDVGDGRAGSISRKVVSKETKSKAAYHVPKNAAKQTKFLSTMSALLALTPTQQQQAAAILTPAVANRAAINLTLKSARQVLGTAVTSNNANTIAQASAQIGTLMAQYVTNGAMANAAFYQLLTADQQAKFAQLQGSNSQISVY